MVVFFLLFLFCSKCSSILKESHRILGRFLWESKADCTESIGTISRKPKESWHNSRNSKPNLGERLEESEMSLRIISKHQIPKKKQKKKNPERILRSSQGHFRTVSTNILKENEKKWKKGKGNRGNTNKRRAKESSKESHSSPEGS